MKILGILLILIGGAALVIQWQQLSVPGFTHYDAWINGTSVAAYAQHIRIGVLGLGVLFLLLGLMFGRRRI
jgi:hypothetical protein